MIGFNRSDDYQPVGWIGRFPIHVATLLVIVHVLTMLGTTLAVAFNRSGILESLIFSSAAVLGQGALWQFLTYAFINEPSIWFAIEMFMLFSFGRELERFIGRHAFLSLYLWLMLMPPLVLVGAGLFFPVVYHGSSFLHFGVFLAFATLYPDVELLLAIRAKWMAWILCAMSGLQSLAYHQWNALLVLSISAVTAYGFIARLRYGSGFPAFTFLRDKLLSVRGKATGRRFQTPPESEEDLMASIDALLDKIARNGLASLTDRERQRLESAREALLKRKP